MQTRGKMNYKVLAITLNECQNGSAPPFIPPYWVVNFHIHQIIKIKSRLAWKYHKINAVILKKDLWTQKHLLIYCATENTGKWGHSAVVERARALHVRGIGFNPRHLSFGMRIKQLLGQMILDKYNFGKFATCKFATAIVFLFATKSFLWKILPEIT